MSSVYGISEDNRVRPTTISDWIDSGIKPCYRVRTRLGRVVEVTGHHPFLTVHGWKPLHDLAVGHAIAVPVQLDCFGSDESMSLDKVRLLAYYIAEGGLTEKSPRFTNTDPVIIDDFKQIITTHFPVCAIRQDGTTYIAAQPRNAMTMKGGAILPKNPVTLWLQEMGLWGKYAKEKSFPACVWTWSRRLLAEFIRTLMSCDGSIYSSNGTSPFIEFTVASKKLAFDLQHAFTRFGILSSCVERTSSCQGKTFASWRVSVTNPVGVQAYQAEIGWIGEKASRFADYTYKICKKVGNLGHAPKETWDIIRAGTNAQGLSLAALGYRSGDTTKQGKYAGYNPQTGRGIPRHRLSAYAEVLDHPGLRRIASPDIYWDEIVSIEPIGEHHVYDLTVPDGSNFIAQDVIVHNTAMSINIAYNAAIKFKRNVGIFSLEMSKEQLAQRFVALDSNVEQQKLRTGRIEDDDWPALIATVGHLAELGIRIDDTSGISLVQMRSRARRWIAEYGIELIIVDYLQLMTTGDNRKYENRQVEVAAISRGLKNLARELHVPVLALAQLSRALESRQSKVPQLSDLRESGSIENDADVVMFIYRDEVYNPETERKNQADIIVAKHRNGPVGDVTLYFNQAQSRFGNLDVALLENGEALVFAAEDDAWDDEEGATRDTDLDGD
jgi:replicative DNA helicase